MNGNSKKAEIKLKNTEITKQWNPSVPGWAHKGMEENYMEDTGRPTSTNLTFWFIRASGGNQDVSDIKKSQIDFATSYVLQCRNNSPP